MNKPRLAISSALTMTLLFGCTALGYSTARAQQPGGSRKDKSVAAGPTITLPPDQVEQGERTQVETIRSAAATKKWEYCTITGGGWVKKEFGSSSPAAWVHYFPSTRRPVGGTTHEEAQANAIATLGEEGWEMVGIREPCDNCFPVFYFKRLK